MLGLRWALGKGSLVGSDKAHARRVCAQVRIRDDQAISKNTTILITELSLNII